LNANKKNYFSWIGHKQLIYLHSLAQPKNPENHWSTVPYFVYLVVVLVISVNIIVYGLCSFNVLPSNVSAVFCQSSLAL
jgi:hypothetical protein